MHTVHSVWGGGIGLCPCYQSIVKSAGKSFRDGAAVPFELSWMLSCFYPVLSSAVAPLKSFGCKKHTWGCESKPCSVQKCWYPNQAPATKSEVCKTQLSSRGKVQQCSAYTRHRSLVHGAQRTNHTTFMQVNTPGLQISTLVKYVYYLSLIHI